MLHYMGPWEVALIHGTTYLCGTPQCGDSELKQTPSTAVQQRISFSTVHLGWGKLRRCSEGDPLPIAMRLCVKEVSLPTAPLLCGSVLKEIFYLVLHQ